MGERYFAHIRNRENGEKEFQSVKRHCEATAKYARECLAPVSLGESAYLAGLIHDMGKRTGAYQNYIIACAEGKNPPRGSVNHTFAGVRLLLEKFHLDERAGGREENERSLVCEWLAFAAGAHHGLFDCVDIQHQSGFQHRIKKADIGYEEAVQGLWENGLSEQELSIKFERALEEMKPCISKMAVMAQNSGATDRNAPSEELSFYFGFFARLLLSAVIEGDRRDTAEFMNEFVYPQFPDNKEEFWSRVLFGVEAKLNDLEDRTPIQAARRKISNQCRAFAENGRGVIRLNVPTGAGKTLSSLRFSLAHAAKWGKSRILYVSPLLSILEQNAKVLHEFIGEDKIILEHHSNVVREHMDEDELDMHELFAENWNVPVIITTLVQLLNTLFSGKTTCIRRFQSLCNSIIIIDEVQTVPAHMLSLFNLAVNFLVEIAGVTVVLCSATQPCFEKASHPINVPISDMVPYQEQLWDKFRRTKIAYVGSRSLEEIPELAWEILEQTDSLLIVCNKKEEAERLFHFISKENVKCVHLSASMCQAHRKAVLEEVKEALKRIEEAKKKGCRNIQKLVCVSTQVIEAGVDISFSSVIRLAAGMDSVVQAAGRCNRNGESAEPMPVYVVRCRDEQLGFLEDIERGKDATLELLENYEGAPEKYGNDLTGDRAIEEYYHILYREMRQKVKYEDFVVKENGQILTIFSLLSDNRDLRSDSDSAVGSYMLQQAFRLAGKLFQVFDRETTDVLVSYGEGGEIIQELCSERAVYQPVRMRELLDKGKAYTISLYRYQVEILERQNALYSVCGGRVMVLQDNYYDENTGLTLSAGGSTFLEE
ncbi:MAG: CRISPR-associated helicase Cas3' [Roseburia sp.]|nr:CRISPR-associated helicase Cas3' [Roseburia sp.]